MLNVLVVEDSSFDLFWLKNVLAETGIQHALSVAETVSAPSSFYANRESSRTRPRLISSCSTSTCPALRAWRFCAASHRPIRCLYACSRVPVRSRRRLSASSA